MRRDPNQLPEDLKLYRGLQHVNDFYVSPSGTDKWTGTIPEPNAQRSDGPFRTIERACRQLAAHPTPGPVTVHLRAGVYPMETPLRIGAGQVDGVRFAAYTGEEVVLDGGIRIGGWKATTLEGIAVWAADLPGLGAGTPVFRQLFVNGRRAVRARFPKEGTYRMEAVPETPTEGFMAGPPSDCFVSAPGDMRAWRNLTDVDIVAFHYWNEERLPVVSFDPQTRMVRCSRKSAWPLKDDAVPGYARYRVENVREALREPGEWYLDRAEKRVFYVPRPGEKIEEVVAYAPVMEQLALVEGTPERPVHGVAFEGLTFRHAEWSYCGERGSFEQAAHGVPAAIALRYARHCTIRNCTIERCGMYAIELGEGCVANRIEANRILDMGAGGVKCVGTAGDMPASRCGNNVITDNEIAGCGHVFHSAVGILIIHSADNVLARNHIHHLEYSGVSCGWIWGYGPNPTHGNLIEGNHIHHIGSGLLNDMGGIYTLGEQPGTVIRGNRIHDVRMHNYGGWALYLDEGSSYMTIEGNICHDTDSEVLQLHYGRNNFVRNNIFAFSKLGIVSVTVVDESNPGLIILNNVLVSDGGPVFIARNRETLKRRGFMSDLNVIWDVSGKPAVSADQHRNASNTMVRAGTYGQADMAALGHDRHSIYADPRFRDVAARDFSVLPGGPSESLGIRLPDSVTVGPRRRGQ
jgi:hypothetical protein